MRRFCLRGIAEKAQNGFFDRVAGFGKSGGDGVAELFA
jgi:hypothetical protein